MLGSTKPDEWRKILEQCLEKVECPYRYDIYNTSLRIWNPADQKIDVPESKYTCHNGYEIQKVAFGREKEETLIGITFARLVFEPKSKFPLPFSSDELFSKGKYPEVLRHQPMVIGIEALITFFNNNLVRNKLEPHINYQVVHQAQNIYYRFGNCSESLAEVVKNPGLSKNLLGSVRRNRAIAPSSVKLGVLSNNVNASDKALRIGSEIVNVLHEWQCSASLKDLKNGDGIESFLAATSQGQPIILVPLDGKKGDRPPDATINWLRYLDSEKAAFQLCSTASNPLYSRHGLAIAILGKANGSIFVTEPIGFPEFHNSWFIGLDLGKGGLNKGKIVVITLTSPDGNLQAYWRARKNDDETLSPKILSEGLSWMASKADLLGKDRHLYLIRDGLRPHKESLDCYREALSDHNFTLIEYSKSGSPLIHCSPFEPEPGTTILPEESGFTALYPCISPQSGVLTIPVKFRTLINPNRHSMSDIALLLTSLCHSATLSYQPSRLPAPLQWANGLARLSYKDLQFSGWSHRASRLLNLTDW
ncbi:hypothetical protein [Calothrix sp. UHCC 0171]|uniref:hypothetical protein n=1 Tax=Calothrix sp. UHCC 0171 TaxID=3110245 RepID=UPI002B1FECEA|nr:hypothetical protein [Calothrix sp. UHCC 0171]MEA5571920.1 hypothetical protein [Calothrix sp. UHCC 0171]